jgi:hypothetical protein
MSQVRTQPKQRVTRSAPIAAQPLQSEKALAVLKELQDSGKLVLAVAGEMGRRMGFRYTGALAKENCFGWRVSGDRLVIGESSGGFYGVNFTGSDSGKKVFQMIGFIHSQTDMSIAGKPVKTGTYVLYAALDELALDNREMSLSSTADLHFALARSLDPNLFVNEKNGKSPRYKLIFENNSLWLVIGDNKLAVDFTKN